MKGQTHFKGENDTVFYRGAEMEGTLMVMGRGKQPWEGQFCNLKVSFLLACSVTGCIFLGEEKVRECTLYL